MWKLQCAVSGIFGTVYVHGPVLFRMCDPEKEPVKSGCKNCLPKDHIFNNWVCCAGVSSDFFMYHGVVAVD